MGSKTKKPQGIDGVSENPTKEKRRIWKNIIVICFAFLFNFNAYQGLSRLQSSLHRVEGMGVITSSVVYGALVLSCMFLPKIIIHLIGHRWTIAISFSGYILWMAANGYAVWATMIIGSILVGVCAAPLWTAQCSYFTIAAHRYAKINGEKPDAVVSRFFGVFFAFFQFSSITGSIISSTVLKPTFVNPNDTDISADMSLCGANDCPYNNHTNPNLEPVDSTTVWTMVGIYIGIACLAVIVVALFVDNLPKEAYDRSGNIKKDVLKNFLATFRHLRHKKQLLVIPITMYSGFEQAFFSAEWSASFVSCSLGIWKVGLTTIAFGCVNAVVSFTGGQVTKYIGRVPLFVLGACVDIGIQITLMLWTPDTTKEYVFFIIAGLWGLTDGIWQTQINTLYGCLFGGESEEAFSNYRMWESFGFIIAFAYSNYLCTSTKLYVLISVLGAGMIGYFMVEWVHYKEMKSNQSTSSASVTKHGKQAEADTSSSDQSDKSTVVDAYRGAVFDNEKSAVVDPSGGGVDNEAFSTSL